MAGRGRPEEPGATRLSFAPLVSIVVPTHNRLGLLPACLRSIEAQTYDNLEVIVVDDASTDGTSDWLAGLEYTLPLMRRSLSVNRGASIARNIGIAAARGDLVAFIDSDDLLGPRHCERAVEIMADDMRAGLFCCDAVVIDENDEELNDGRSWHEVQRDIKGYEVRTGPRTLADIFLFSNCFPGFTFSSAALRRLGGFDQGLFPLDDYDLAMRVAADGYRVFYCHEPHARYRVHGTNASGASNGDVVGRQKVRCLKLALDRFPIDSELDRSTIRRRLAEAESESAIGHWLTRRHAQALRYAAAAVIHEPSLGVELSSRAIRRAGARVLRW